MDHNFLTKFIMRLNNKAFITNMILPFLNVYKLMVSPTQALLVLTWKLASDRELIGDDRNGYVFNVIAGLTVWRRRPSRSPCSS